MKLSLYTVFINVKFRNSICVPQLLPASSTTATTASPNNHLHAHCPDLFNNINIYNPSLPGKPMMRKDNIELDVKNDLFSQGGNNADEQPRDSDRESCV